MGRHKSLATERITVVLQDRVLDLMSKEAALAQVDRSAFLRQLIGRAMGTVDIRRAGTAPSAAPYPPANTQKLLKRDFKLEPHQKRWLRETSVKAGSIPISAILTLLVLDWAEINPLRETQ